MSAEPRRCVGIVVIPLDGGGTRQVKGCDSRVTEQIDEQYYCYWHANQHRYERRRFQQMMDTATRHSQGIRLHGKGVWCSCGVFVKDGEAHPWGVPAKEEDALAAASKTATGPTHTAPLSGADE